MRDEHTAVLNDGIMYVFGGFERGVRQNSIICYDFNTAEWSEVNATSSVCPPTRAGHSACVYEGKMFIFGGKDEDN